MILIRRMIAVILLALSTLFCILSVAMAIGAWLVNEPLTAALLGPFDAANNTLQLVENGFGQAQGQVAGIEARVHRMETRLAEVGAGAANAPRPPELKGEAAETLAQIRRLAEVIDRISERAAIARQILRAMHGLPLGQIAEPQTDQVEAAAGEATALDQLGGSFGERISSVAELTRDAAMSLQQSLAAIDTRLQSVRMRLASAQSTIDAAQRSVTSMREGIPFWIDIASWVASLVCLLSALAFASLFGLAWRMLTGRDLLARFARAPGAVADKPPLRLETPG